MKKTILLLAIAAAIFSSKGLHAQCTPNALQNIFLIPDTATDFAPAFTYVPYSDVLYIKVPKDTVIYIFPATIDSIVVQDIAGLPASLTYNCNPASCSFYALTSGCIQISGTPTAAEIGNYPLTISADVTGNAGFLGDTTVNLPVTGYRIRVIDSAYMGIADGMYDLAFRVQQNAPNPAVTSTEISFSLSAPANISFELRDITGKLVRSRSFYAPRGINTLVLDVSDVVPGLYFYTLNNGEKSLGKKMLITGNQ
jgi:hypothetical protein